MLLVISHSDQFHHNYTLPKNYIFVDVSIYPSIDIELCHQCFALPCECVQMDIMMKEGKGELKH